MDALKSSLENTQTLMNSFIRENEKNLAEGIDVRLKYLPEKQSQNLIEQELVKITERLAEIIIASPIVTELSKYTNNSNFIWESNILEILSPNEIKKYRNIDVHQFDYNKYNSQKNCYDDKLPYFSDIIEYISLNKYADYLNFLENTYNSANKNVEISDIPIDTSKEQNENKIKQLKSFDCAFDDRQIRILTECVNEAKIFSAPVTTKVIKQLFILGKLKEPLIVRSNKLLAYFFASLDDRSYITHNWQSVCDTNELFLTSSKGKRLTRSDLSSANNTSRDNPPKESEIIDKHIKQLKKG